MLRKCAAGAPHDGVPNRPDAGRRRGGVFLIYLDCHKKWRGTFFPVKMPAPSDPRLPPPGNWIVREYKGRTVQVLVVHDGFENEGKRYKSLSAVAAEITGSHINGFRFFKLWGKP